MFMKKTLLLASLVLPVLLVQAQTATTTTVTTAATAAKLPALDKSPMDIAYFPSDYPMIKTQNKTSQPLLARVIYSRPQRDNRVIFGELVEYGKVWRLGANEATEIEFFKDATIAGKKVLKGRYTLYAIPNETKWTIIINKDTDTWGAFIYDQKKDVARADVPVQTMETAVEPFSMTFNKTDRGTTLVIAWDKTSVSLPIDMK